VKTCTVLTSQKMRAVQLRTYGEGVETAEMAAPKEAPTAAEFEPVILPTCAE
jgi:hypothetical protein